MSQIPISTLESGTPPGGQRRQGIADVPRVGVTQSLGVYGLQAAPPVSRGAMQAAQLADALGLAGGLAGTLGRQFSIERRDREAEQAKIDSLYDGQARLDARTQLPELLKPENIDAMTASIPDGMPIGEYTAQLLNQHLDGLNEDGSRQIPDAYARAYRNVAQPALAEAIVNRQAQIKAEHTADLLTNARYADDPAQAIAEMRSMGVDVTQRKELEVLALALGDSAAAGSAGQDRFNRMAPHVADTLGANELVDRLRPTLAGNIDAEQRKIEGDLLDATEDRVTRLTNAGLYEVARQAVSDSGLRPAQQDRFTAQIDRAASGQLQSQQDAYANALRERILLQDTDPAELRGEILTAIQRPSSDPRHVDETAAKTMLNDLGQTVKVDESKARVQSRLTGKNVALTSDDDKAIMELLGSGNQPVIDAGGQITSPERLAVAVGRLDRLPTDIVQRIDAGAQSDNVADVATAGHLYWSLKRTAPAALAKASNLSDTARMRLETMVSRLEADSPPTLTQTGDPNPEALKRITEEAQRALPLNAEATAGVESGPALLAFTNTTKYTDAHEEARRLMREALPEYAQQRKVRDIFGFDTFLGVGIPFVNRDAEISLEELPPTFTTSFRDKASRWYVNLTHAGWSPQAARDTAAKNAIQDLEADYIFAVAQDRLYVLPRYDNPADLRWTAQSGEEFVGLFDKAQKAGNIPDTTSADEWRPITVKGDNWFQFVHADDPLNVLTDSKGEPIRFRPQTPLEMAREAQAELERRATQQAARDTDRVMMRKLDMVEWVIQQRRRRDNGQSYDHRLEQIDDEIRPEHIEWYRGRRPNPWMTFRRREIPADERKELGLPPSEEPPLIGIDPIKSPMLQQFSDEFLSHRS